MTMTTPIQDGDPRCIHAQSIKKCVMPTTQNRAFFNNLITLYSKFNLHSSALQLFHSIPCPNTVTWTSIISAFVSSPLAFRLFLAMIRHPRQARPNARTFATLLRSCALFSDYSVGQQLQSMSLKLSLHENSFVGSAFVSMYCKSRDLDAALKVFDEMPDRDEVCYAAVINGLAQNQRPLDALWYFVEMKRENVDSTCHSVSGALSAASRAAMLQQCMIIHGHAVVTGLDFETYVATSLIDGYGKCGIVEEARKVFDESEMELNVIGWNTMMAAYAQQGSHGHVIELFRLMESRGIKADEYSFLAVLTAFYNAGMVEETEMWMNRMRVQYGLEPTMEHYTCLVGAMGRAGKVEEAEKVAMMLPYEPDAAVWRVLLSSCANNRNPEVAWRMTKRLLEINPNDDSAYVILANAFASSARWNEVKKVWKMMRNNGVMKEVGWSWIEVQGQTHVFVAGDKRHSRNDEIHTKLTELMWTLRNYDNTILGLYPKVKVREEIEEADQYEYGRSSLQSLKAFEWLSLDHYSSDNSKGSVLRIPGSSSPKSPTPGFQASKEEIRETNRALKDGSYNYVRATSAPRLCPRAVLSSPDRDRLNGSKTQTRRELLTPLKCHSSCLNRHTRCMTRSGDAEIAAQQWHNKHPMESKKNIQSKRKPTSADEKRHQKKEEEASCS